MILCNTLRKRNHHFCLIIRKSSIQDLEKITIQFEHLIKEILIVQKCDCWRHKVFLRGACEEYAIVYYNISAGMGTSQMHL